MEYKKTSHSTMDGEMYEVRYSALLFLRCLNDERLIDFQLASNVYSAGALDDVVLRYKTRDHPDTWNTIFLQLKQKKSKGLSEGMVKSKLGDFSLQKYLQSIRGIRDKMTGEGEREELFNGSFENAQFLLFTNAKPDEELTRQYRDDHPLDYTSSSLLTHSVNCDLIVLSFANIEGIDPGQILNEENQCDDLVSGGVEIPNEFDALSLKSNGEAVESDLVLHGENVDKDIIRRFKIFASQPNVSQLEDIIKQELVLQGRASETDVDMLYHYYESSFENWWQKSKTSVILDRRSLLYEEALEKLISNLSCERQKEWCFDVEFQDIEYLRKELLSSSVQLFHVKTETPRLSCTKVLQCLVEESYFMFELDYLHREMRKILVGWSTGDRNTLVVLCRCTSAYKEVQNDLRRILNKNEQKRVIVVSRPDDDFVGRLKELCHRKKKEIEDVCKFNHLSQESAERLVEVTVKFQGYPVKLKKILGNATTTECLEQIYLEDSLVDGISNGIIPEVGKALSEDMSCYIPRSVERYTLINTNILEADLKSVFCFTGISKEQLEKMVLPDKRVELFEMGKSIEKKCRFLLLKSDRPVREFEKLCERIKKGVHWLHRHGPYFEWKSSCGLLEELRPYVVRDIPADVRKVENCLDVTGNHKIVILDGEPGMGKTTLLSHVVRNTKEMFPFFWVIHVNLSERIELVESSCSEIIEFLSATLGLQTSFEKSFLRYVIMNTGHAFVAIDGYNEVYNKHESKVFRLVQDLMTTKVKRIWLTSQAFSTPKLELQFSTFAVHLKSFSEEDQIKFLTRYWSENAKESSRSDSDLRSVAVQMLRKVAASVSNGEKLFTGNPLQIMMLAEVFTNVDNLPENLNVINSFDAFIEKKFLNQINKTNIIRDKSILTILKNSFIDKHLEASLVYLIPSNSFDELIDKDEIMDKTNTFLLDLTTNGESTGIIDGIYNKRPRFVHRCFAEYFAAIWFSKYYHKNRSFIRNRLFDNYFSVVWKFLNNLLASGKELHRAVLSNDIGRVEELIVSGADVNATDSAGRTPLHLAAGGDFEMTVDVAAEVVTLKSGEQMVAVDSGEVDLNNQFVGPLRHMVHVLLENGSDVNVRDDLVESSPLYYAVMTCAWHNVEVLLSYGALPAGVTLQLYIDSPLILRHLISHGYISLLHWMLDLGLCASNTLFIVERITMHGHLELVKRLVNKGADVLKTNVKGRSLLHQAAQYGQVRVLEYFLRLLTTDMGKAVCTDAVNVLDVLGYSPMLIACLNGYDTIVDLLVSWGGDLKLLKDFFPRIFTRCCLFGFMDVIRRIDKACGKNSRLKRKCINHLDDDGGSNLMKAVSLMHEEVIDYLLNNGVDVKACNEKGFHALDMAITTTFLSASLKILDSFGDDRVALKSFINKSCNTTRFTLVHEACTPFFFAYDWTWFFSASNDVLNLQSCQRAEILRHLILKGGDVTLRSDLGNTALLQASYSFNSRAIQVIIESFDGDERSLSDYINLTNVDKLTALHCACMAAEIFHRPNVPRSVINWVVNEQLQSIRLLLTHGGDITLLSLTGKTPLHFACEFICGIEVAMLFLETFKGNKNAAYAYLNATDSSGKTARDCAQKSPFLTEAQRAVIEVWYTDVLSQCT